MMVVAFDPSHLESFEPGRWERALMVHVTDEWAAAQRGLGVSLRDGDRTLAMAGALDDGPVWTFWALLSDEARARPMALHRATLRGIAKLKEMPHLRQIVAHADAEHTDGRRWLERLGFQAEGLCPDYLGLGRDFVRYVQ